MDSYFYIKSIKTKKDKISIRTVTTFKGGTDNYSEMLTLLKSGLLVHQCLLH